jgi:hypothetical protein
MDIEERVQEVIQSLGDPTGSYLECQRESAFDAVLKLAREISSETWKEAEEHFKSDLRS